MTGISVAAEINIPVRLPAALPAASLPSNSLESEQS